MTTRYKKYKKSYKKYQTTPKAYVINMYDRMLRRPDYKRTYKGKKPTFTLDELREFIKTTNFTELFDGYVGSGRKLALAPTVDRIDNDKGYDIDNIRVITHSENASKGSYERKYYHGRCTPKHKLKSDDTPEENTSTSENVFFGNESTGTPERKE